MTKFLRCLILALFFLTCFAQTSEAVLKFDVSKSVGKVTTTVSGWLEVAKKQMEQSATIQTIIAYGKGAAETAKKLKEMKQSADELKGKVKSAIDEAAGLKDGVISAGKNALDSAAGEVMSKTEEARKLFELKAQKMALENERDEEILAAQEQINSKIALANDNIGKLQIMINQEPDQKNEYNAKIADYREQIEQYNEELKNTTSRITNQYQQQIAATDKQIADLRDEAISKSGTAMANKLKSVLGGGSKQDAAAMTEMIKNNFLEEDDALTIENIVPRQAYRKLTALKDTMSVFNNAWMVKKSRYDNDQKAQELQEAVDVMDGSTSALGMDIRLKVENINALLEYTRMMVNELKMITAHELNDSNNWKLNNYDKEVTEFNLDDYVYKKEPYKNKARDILKNVKENGLGAEAEKLLGSAADSQSDKKSASSAATDTPLEAVRNELRQVRAKSGHFEGVETAGPTNSAPVNVTEELRRARKSSADKENENVEY